MLSKLAIIGLAASIGFALVGPAPMAAIAQAAAAPSPAHEEETAGARATAKARECSRDADAKGLQDKPRKKFIAACKKS